MLNLAAELGTLARACKIMGYSRATFYRYQQAVASGGIEAMPIAAIQISTIG